jgi:hypothetical protein
MKSHKFQRKTFKCSYTNRNGETVTEEFEVYVRDIIDCLKEHLYDIDLLKSMNWWATRKFLCLGNIQEEVQIFDDVQSGFDLWAKQDILGKEGISLPLIFFADATAISRFNGRNFHPVILQNGLIPSHLRSGSNFGGGLLIGYLMQASASSLSLISFILE